MHSLSKSENGAMKEVALSNTGHHSLQWMLVIMIMVIPRVGERTAERWLSRIGWSQRGLKGHPSQLHSHYSSFRADTICTNRTSPLCIIFYHPASLCLSAHHQQHHPTVHHQHTWYLSREPREYPCEFFLAGVNFYRFNLKNWQFTVYFAVMTQKIGNFLFILS